MDDLAAYRSEISGFGRSTWQDFFALLTPPPPPSPVPPPSHRPAAAPAPHHLTSHKWSAQRPCAVDPGFHAPASHGALTIWKPPARRNVFAEPGVFLAHEGFGISPGTRGLLFLWWAGAILVGHPEAASDRAESTRTELLPVAHEPGRHQMDGGNLLVQSQPQGV